MKAIEQLERQGCFSDDWEKVTISEETDLSRIRNVYFRGPVEIGTGVEIINVPGGISGVRIADNARIVNVARIECSPHASFGAGTDVAVLDETGGRPVRIYPGLSSQIATLAARVPEFSKKKLTKLIDSHIASLPDRPEIGEGVEITDCGPIIDVRIWPEVKVEGASFLKNGSIINNIAGTPGLTYIGQGVNAENFIIEDASVANGVILRNAYIGQGCVIDKGFTAHDSLFFANCTMENGEACAVLAGPYTVSMHKSSLLIGVQTSFMNAGSGTNMSNHLYKLGPLHWGILERGVKTSSNSYLMHGSRIGAFSLVMGSHKTHPDTSDFPFSYIFGNDKGNTSIVPGAMLRSYGLKRDANKWPGRDRRNIPGLDKIDRITFHTFNPLTMTRILRGLDIIDNLLIKTDKGVETVAYKGLSINRRSLERGRRMYEMALMKYIDLHPGIIENSTEYVRVNGQWIDLGGLLMTDRRLAEAMSKESIAEMEEAFGAAEREYEQLEQKWIAEALAERIKDPETISGKAAEFDAIVEADLNASKAQISTEGEMLSKF